MGEPAAGSAGPGASARGGAARGGDERLIGEYYDTYARTRLMLVREFESCGASRGRAVSAAQSFLDCLVFVLYVEDAGMVEEKDLLRNGVVEVMNTRFSGCGARVWGCIVDELFDWFGRGSSDPRMAGFGGSLFDAEFGPNLSFLDRRPADFFAGLLPPRGRRPRRLWEEAERAAVRNRNTSPAVRCLLDLSSYDYAGQMRVAVLARVFERSVADLEALAGMGGHAGARRDDALRIPEYVARYACRRAIMTHLSRSGAAEDPASLVAEYASDLGSLCDRLARIRVLDPACGAGAFLAEAASALLDVHREVRLSREASGDVGRGTLDGAIDEGRAGAIVRDNVWGMGASEQSVEATRLTLFLLAASPNEGLPDLSRNIVVGDAASRGGLDWGDAFPGALGKGFSVVVGRMPRAECGTAQPAAGHGAPADGGLECAYYRSSLAALAEGGRMGLVSGGEWLRPDCGRPLQRAILGSAEIARIVVPAFGAAGGAGMAVALLRRGRPRGGSVAELAWARSAGDFERARHRLATQIAQDGMEPGDWRALFPGAAAGPPAAIRRAGRRPAPAEGGARVPAALAPPAPSL